MKPSLLLVDDDAAARRMLRRVLQRLGYDDVREATDGASGVAAALADPPAAILLDLRMPGTLSGADAARALRRDPRTAATPIIVVSASTHLAARDMTHELGCDAFVEKPVDFDELARVLAELLST